VHAPYQQVEDDEDAHALTRLAGRAHAGGRPRRARRPALARGGERRHNRDRRCPRAARAAGQA